MGLTTVQHPYSRIFRSASYFLWVDNDLYDIDTTVLLRALLGLGIAYYNNRLMAIRQKRA